MILTPQIWVRLAALGVLTALAQVTFFAKLELLGTNPDGAVLVVAALGLLGGSVAGAVSGFAIGLLIDCLLMQTLGAFAATLMAVGYAAGRYRESLGTPGLGGVALLGAAYSLLGALAFAAIQIGTGVDADVSLLVVRDAAAKTVLGGVFALPLFLGVRIVLRPALVDDRPSGRRPATPRAAESRS